MGGIGQNILREIREDGESNYKQPSIIELLKSLIKMESTKIDLSKCEKGDILISRHGAKLEYIAPTPWKQYTYLDHVVRYIEDSNGNSFGNENYGTRTNDGFVFAKKRIPEIDHDIVKVIKKEKYNQTEIKYSKEQFEGFTHRFIVKFKVDEDWRNDVNIHIYSNSDSYQKLEEFLNARKSDKVLSFKIEHRASKEQDEMASKFIDEILGGF